MSPSTVAAVAAGLLVATVAAMVRPRGAGRAPGGGAPRVGRGWLHRRRQAPPPTEAWVALLDALAADVRSGASLRSAWATSAAWPAAGATLRRDAFPADEAHHPPGLARSADETVVAHAARVAAELGGPVAATLDAAAALLRERLAARAEAAAHAAQARLSARVLTAVPLVFAVWSVLTSGSFRAALLSPAGTACAAAGGVLNLTGWAWMRRLVRAAAGGGG